MRVVVAVKQVAVLDEEFELRDDAHVDEDGIEWALNEWDDFALEAALQLGEAAGDTEVVVVTVGDDEADEALLACLAKGADRAVRIADDALVDADPIAVARVLAAVVERESPDLVLCGVQSSDAVNGATGVALAGHLDMAHVAVVTAIELDGGRLAVRRELEGGLVESVSLPLPALLTVQTGINEPRYATLRAIKQAREKPLEVVALSDIGLDGAEIEAVCGGRVRRLSAPERSGRAQMLDGSPRDVAERIAEIVREELRS